jgi:hypothetical protein
LKPSSSAAAAVAVVAQVPARVVARVPLLHKESRLLLQASLTPLRLVAVALVVQHHCKAHTEPLADLGGYWPCLVVVVGLVQTLLEPQLILVGLAPVMVAVVVAVLTSRRLVAC